MSYYLTDLNITIVNMPFSIECGSNWGCEQKKGHNSDLVPLMETTTTD